MTPVIEPVASKFELLTWVAVQELATQEDAPCGLEKPITKQRTANRRATKESVQRCLCLWQRKRIKAKNKTKSKSKSKAKTKSTDRGVDGRRGARKKEQGGKVVGERRGEVWRKQRERSQKGYEVNIGKRWERGVGTPKTPRPLPQSMIYSGTSTCTTDGAGRGWRGPHDGRICPCKTERYRVCVSWFQHKRVGEHNERKRREQSLSNAR